MEKIKFIVPDTKEEVSFFVEEETTLGGKKYLLVTEEEDSDSDAYIIEEIADDKDDITYQMVEDEKLLEALGKVFAELLEDTDILF